ncbi:putative paraquat-inducible protein A [Saonia flava]|uniref:Putative paraquat-inducible protein A n=1 Tax=Saonia flava TaxID=523696 RepID=A0A846QXS4_9FLAO|nr:heavy metal-binding domain-containing protein [Saonia flava]NJB71023.1 putative paraquat-inducible protein A [Saonia flava]
MNTKIKTLVTIAFLATFFLSVSCKGKAEKNNETTTEQSETTEEVAKEYASAYVCPMHCEGSGSDTEGTCPKCGMAYVANEEHQKDGHKH